MQIPDCEAPTFPPSPPSLPSFRVGAQEPEETALCREQYDETNGREKEKDRDRGREKKMDNRE